MSSKNFEVSDLLDCYGGILTEKQRFLIECYYNDDLSLAEIAENEGITRQGVRDTIKRAETQLFECEMQLKHLEQMKKTSQLADDICSLAAKIKSKNNDCADLADKIISLCKEI
ncbi:MAG: DNA-binding protein [Clostridia bacterium]|nr:DNA-binding protein [Clostridia bacterium]